MNHDHRDVLLKAASIVEQGWCQGVLARDAEGHQTTEYSADAVSWCAMGAMLRAAHDVAPGTFIFSDVEAALMGELDGFDYVSWNDAPGRTAHQVAEAMRRAAE